MDATAAVLAGQSKKYNIPLSHFEHKYIQNCTDGKELERIYKELIGGELGSFKDLENLTLDRLRDVKPNSQLLRQDKHPLERSALSEDERREFDDFLQQMNNTTRTSSNITKDQSNNGIDSHPIRTKSIVTNSITPTSSKPVINNNGKPKRIVPRSYAEWGKLDQKLSQELNSDNDEEEEDDHDDNQDTKPPIKPRVLDQIPEKSQRLQMAEQHRLNGNKAFKANNYQQSIDLYTNSILLDRTNPVVYMNRAIAYYKLNNYDASITDCSEVLSKDSQHIKALYRRASCYIAKQQYDQAKADLNNLLAVDSENSEAKSLMEQIPTVPKTKSVRIPITEDDGDDEEIPQPPPPPPAAAAPVPVKIPILEVEEEEEEEEEEELQESLTNGPNQSMNIDIPKSAVHARPCIDSQEASPATFDSHFHHRDDMNQFQQNMNSQLSSLHTRTNHANDDDDDDDEMALGDEASGLIGNMSDDDGNNSHSMNVSPTTDDDNDDEPPELIEQKTLRTLPLTSITKPITSSNSIDHHSGYRLAGIDHRTNFSSTENDDPYDQSNIPTISNNYSSIHSNSLEQRSSTINSIYDQISNSNFSSTLQSWLRDLAVSQLNNRPSSSFSTKLWSKSMRPYILDRLQRDIERFYRLNDLKNAVEASKKMLKNGLLDYHKHAEYIVDTLKMCAQCYAKTNHHPNTIQYTSEALQYDRTDTTALMYRAKAFEKDGYLVFSYADYARIPSNNLNFQAAQQACKELAIELNAKEGKTWSNQLPKDNNDDDRYLTYIKIRDKLSESDPYVWYRSRGNQLYMDGCFVLAIRCFTHCIEIKSDVAFPYTNRAACYLKLFEATKALTDCVIALKLDPTNVRALYRKACAYKMLSNDTAYRSTLQELLKIQPHNQNVVAEYFASQHEPIPRKMRRLRPVSSISIQSTPTTTLVPSTEISTSTSTTIFEDIQLSYEELEEIRLKKLSPFTINNKYQFTQQLNTLKSNDMKAACSLILRLPDKGLFKIITSTTPKLIETMVKTIRTMIYAEKRYQQEHKSLILPFSYVKFAFNLLCELTTLPRLDSNISMIDQTTRALLDDILTYFSSISSILTGIDKLDRLRK